VFLEKLSKVFDFIDDAFSCSEFVPAVALVLGATLVSAKVDFRIRWMIREWALYPPSCVRFGCMHCTLHKTHSSSI
jgi:hypothetical protein